MHNNGSVVKSFEAFIPAVIGFLAISAIASLFLCVVYVGIEREIARVEAQADYNCMYYSEHIKELYGRDSCDTVLTNVRKFNKKGVL